jgi:uncharacterized membrane protein
MHLLDLSDPPFTPSVRRQTACIALLVATYAAGVAGIGLDLHPGFLRLTPLNLLLSFVLLLLAQPAPRTGVWRYMLVAALAGYFIEVAGVATAAIFGRYAYGTVLGPQWLDVPLVIGINWAMLTFAAGDVASRWFPRSTALRVLTGALLPVGLDVLIEPVAIDLGMWHWYGSVPPWQNYAGWFVLSLILSMLYQRWVGPAARNAAAPWLLALQALFFLCLQPQ